MGYRLLWPLSPERFELGWIGSESTVVVAIPVFVATLVLWTVIERRKAANLR